MSLKTVIIKPTKDKSIKRFHPWIFSGAIKSIDPEINEGDIVEVYANKGKYLATGHYQDGSIAIRIFEFQQQEIGAEYWKTKIQKAYNARKELGLMKEMIFLGSL